MTEERKHAIEAAKELISMSFNPKPSPFKPKKEECVYFDETKAPRDIQRNLFEVSGQYSGRNKSDNTIILNCEGKNLSLFPIKDTMYSDSIVGAKVVVGDSWYVIALKVEEENICIPITILREEEKEKFMMVKSLYGRAHAVRAFYKLEKGKRKTIERRLQSKRFGRFEPDSDTFFSAYTEQTLLYALTKETYTMDAQKTIESIIAENDISKGKGEQRLQYILSIASTYEKRDLLDACKVEQTLNKRFYKMERAKQLIKDLFSGMARADKSGCTILFVGPPGVGKTSLMMAIAEGTNRPFESIPMNGLSHPIEIDGIDPKYDGADAGVIAKTFAAYRTSEMVVGLDEFDKINRDSKDGDPMNTFLKIFQGELYDKYLQCTIKTDNTIFIATANSVENIPEPIRNRFDAIIYLDEYSCEDKMTIAREYIIPSVLKNYHIDPEKVQFDKEAIRCIITRYCEDDGARDLEHNIKIVVNRVISQNRANVKTVISSDYVEEVLFELIEETPGLYFSRNKEFYSEPVAKEIKKCIEASKKTPTNDSDCFGTDKKREKLNYLLACKKEQGTYLDAFEPNKFNEMLHENLYGMDKVIKEATNFYYTAYLQGSNLTSNLALCGGYGTGKTSIAKNIAKAMNYPYVRISLNGVEDSKELRGFPITYTGSEPGRIMKGYKGAGSLRAVVLLDEIDKIKPELAIILLDLLDREFTDNFLDVPVDLTQSIFIATANEWGNVPAVLRDRFIVVDVDGYSRSEKGQILTDYIIPKLEKGYAASGVSIAIDDDAETYLLKTYANSFGVRDAEKAMQRICSTKLVEQAGTEKAMQVNICKSDIRKYLGEEPIPRGNFPENGCVPGISKALAVSNSNTGSCFAIETVLIDGGETLEITGLPKESASDSVKIAVTCIKKMYPALLKGKHIHVHFGEGSVPKDGSSAGVALFMSILSAAIEKPIMDKKPYDIAYTGEISLTGGVFAIGGTYEKIQAACDTGCSKVFIPMQNYERLDRDKLKEFDCKIIPVGCISQVVAEIFPELSEG